VSDKAFADLPPSVAHYLQQFQIGPGKWDALREGALHTTKDGGKFLIPDLMMSAKRDVVERGIRYDATGDYHNEEVRRVIGGMRDAYMNDPDLLRRQLSMDLWGMLHDHVRYAVLEPGHMTRRLLLQGTQGGTLAGEFLRFATMFKSFPVEFTDRVLGRSVLDHAPTSARTWEPVNGIRLDTNLFKMLGTMTMAGYVSMSLKNIAKGYTPGLPTDPDVIMQSMVQGGTMGVYGDLISAASSYSPGKRMASFVAGPVLSDVGTALTGIYTKALGDQADQRDATAKLVNLGISNIPYQNHAMTHLAMNYLLYHNIRERFVPGYDRMQDYKKYRDHRVIAWGRPHD
jgi:hypothetical protein